MSQTMHKSTRAAVFVIVILLVVLAAAAVLYFLYADTEPGGIFLLGGCALAAFVFAVLAIRVAMAHRRSLRLERDHGVRPNPVLRSLDLRQWMLLTLGVAFLAVATGAATALRVLPADQVEAAPPGPVTPTPAPTTPATTEAPETAEPSFTTDPPEESPTPEPSESVPQTEATKYLDEEEALEGGFNREAVSFDSDRYTRSVQFTCSTARSSYVQWNVAGYRQFTTVAGIDDNTRNAFGETVEFIFYDQSGRELLDEPVDVSVGTSAPVSLDLTGVTSLRIVCSSRETRTNEPASTLSALGDPVVTQ